jgi:hypothetical protein
LSPSIPTIITLVTASVSLPVSVEVAVRAGGVATVAERHRGEVKESGRVVVVDEMS